VVFAGAIPIVQLYEADAKAAGDTTLDVHAAAVATSVRQAILSERERSRVAKNVMSLSFVVCLALVALHLMKRVGDLSDRIGGWLNDHGDRVLRIRVQRIEIATPAVLKSTALVALGLAKWIGLFGIFYSWLVLVLSFFESTRGYTERLTGFVVTPLSQLMGRLAMALPLLVVAGFAALAVAVLIRFVGLFFAGVARRETALTWLPADLAAPTSVLLRVGIVVAALVFLTPVVTGDADGALGRAGLTLIVAIGLSCIPILATGLMGVVVLFGRRVRVGDHVELLNHSGRVASVNLLELRLQTAESAEVRVPHLSLLRQPVRVLGQRPRISVELSLASGVAPATAFLLLEEAATRAGRDVRIDILRADADGVLYRVTAVCESLEGRSLLWLALIDGLNTAGVALGRAVRAEVPRT